MSTHNVFSWRNKKNIMWIPLLSVVMEPPFIPHLIVVVSIMLTLVENISSRGSKLFLRPFAEGRQKQL